MISLPTDPGFHRAFDIVAWGAALGLGWFVRKWRFADGTSALPVHHGYYISLGAGAITGAYLVGTAPSMMTGAFALSHSVAGALAGAIVAVELYKLATGVKGSTGGVFVAPFALGIVIGRLGCLFAGLADGTYGTPTTLFWGVELGDGVSRHPVQLFESLAMSAFLGAYFVGLQTRAKWALTNGFYVMAVFYGAQRFLWEFLKPYPKLIGPFNIFHIVSLGLVIYGCVFIARNNERPA